MINLSENFGTRLSPDLAAKVRAYANELETGESAVVRLAVKEFYRKPRVTRERIHVRPKPRRATKQAAAAMQAVE